jgi:hypothetical protein
MQNQKTTGDESHFSLPYTPQDVFSLPEFALKSELVVSYFNDL